MVRSGDWLTPRFLGRLYLTKPPLLYWLTAASTSLLGVNSWTLRLPSLIAAAGCCMLVFFVIAQRRPWWIAALAAFALAGSDLFFRAARLGLTDALLTLLFLAALLAWPRPLLSGALTGLAILTKGIAGLLPFAFILLLRPKPLDFARFSLAAAAVALPWHLYQFTVNRDWFLAEYLGVEILRYALGAPPQTSTESTAAFYFGRFFRLDPWLALAGLVALYFAIRKKDRMLALVPVVIAAVFAYQYRNITYWLPLLPVAAILAGRYLPSWAVIALAVVRLTQWPSTVVEPLPQIAAVRQYCELRRANELILVSTDDEFHATLLPLPRVRYAFLAPPPEYGSASLDFRKLQITQSVDEFLVDEFLNDRSRLAPRGTVIHAKDRTELARLISESPDLDFIVDGRLVLSKNSRPSAVTASCRL
jgi:4-amino-4-deoxy-L-arabinose transferase-like glycosyltransferase